MKYRIYGVNVVGGCGLRDVIAEWEGFSEGLSIIKFNITLATARGKSYSELFLCSVDNEGMEKTIRNFSNEYVEKSIAI